MDEARDIKRIHGKSKDYVRADVGEYRIVFRYDNETVVVFVIGKRNDGDVYKKLDRKLL